MTLNLLDIAVIFLIFWGPIFVFWRIHEYRKTLNIINSDGWQENSGSRPALFHADIVLKNGKVKWNVSPKDVNWDRYLKNPVVKFRPANAA